MATDPISQPCQVIPYVKKSYKYLKKALEELKIVYDLEIITKKQYKKSKKLITEAMKQIKCILNNLKKSEQQCEKMIQASYIIYKAQKVLAC